MPRVWSAGLVASMSSASSVALVSLRIPESMTRSYGVRGLSWIRVFLPCLFERQRIALVVAVKRFSRTLTRA